MDFKNKSTYYRNCVITFMLSVLFFVFSNSSIVKLDSHTYLDPITNITNIENVIINTPRTALYNNSLNFDDEDHNEVYEKSVWLFFISLISLANFFITAALYTAHSNSEIESFIKNIQFRFIHGRTYIFC